MDESTARRTFLKQAGLGMAAPVLAQLFAVRRAWAAAFRRRSGLHPQHHRGLQPARAAVEASPKLVWRSPESWELSSALYAVEVRGEKSGDVFERLFGEHGFVFRPFSTPELETIRLSPNVANTVEDVERFFVSLGA